MNSFKTFFSCLLLLFSSSFYSIDLIVTTTGQVGTYTTLSSALVAANSGDRILISNIITLYENDTIDKSVTILPLNSGSRFIMVGSITVKAEANTEIRIVGMELTGDINSISGSADGYNLCQFYMIDCEILGGYDINCDVLGLSLNLLFSKLTSNNSHVTFKQGNLIANEITSGFTINNGIGINFNDTTNIIANRIGGSKLINNSDHFFFIANNYFFLDVLIIKSSNLNSNGENNLLNNTFQNSANQGSGATNLVLHHNFQHYQTVILNNIFLLKNSSGLVDGNQHIGVSQYYNQTPITLNTSDAPKLVRNNAFLNDLGINSVKSSVYVYARLLIGSPFTGATGFDIDSINYINSFPTNSDFLLIDVAPLFINVNNSGKVITELIDAGENFPKYYDIDLTRNDLGTFGGPYSWDNYWNTNNGRARIYELEAPFELPPNQTFNIKSSASHNH